VGKSGRDCSLQVCLTERILSTQRLPFSLAVPWERFRHSTPKRRIRSAWLVVGATPSFSKKSHRQASSLSSARAIALIDANLARIERALASFPDDVYLHTLAGYAAKNVYASSGGTDLLSPAQRKKHLDRARMHFEMALVIDPDDPAAEHDLNLVMQVKSGACPSPE
jgi:hypothetical protein